MSIKICCAWPAFAEAFSSAFGQEVKVLSSPDEVVNFNLVIFSGGEDVDPRSYGEPNEFAYGVNRDRDIFERQVFQYIASDRSGKYALGVCRGHQFINVFSGGKMIQDIYFKLGKGHGGNHPLEVHEETIINSFFRVGEGYSVNSMHHQGITLDNFNRNSVLGIRATASHNGVVEIAEGKRFLTIQGHPEFLSGRFKPLFSFILETIEAKKHFYQPKPNPEEEIPFSDKKISGEKSVRFTKSENTSGWPETLKATWTTSTAYNDVIKYFDEENR